ncbi:MAG: hypothetical protein IIB12_09820, partial [Chloroflexi bacterium]|nr:hypothetical protein [Chloroflexota bacterium]
MLSILDKIYDDLKLLARWLFHRIWPEKTGEDRAADRWQGRPGTLGKGFFGRDADLKTLADAVKTHRVVVTSGGAGAGKSQLAAAHTFTRPNRGFWTTAGTDAIPPPAALAP